ncbi:intein-containing DNA-directed RNA polymerase i subunit rpa1 precursor [Anaeramoeba flamelloides]|uniref:DNA-directed RNA polymerase subunit n=1 Tax=Anaeramoeba flamelloides TaxID=1746091 RepID=A0AAV7Y7F6_9EUKA|nr:intein-containing DNA-directed RNA polymerase i subunit rpa1 precursor [Anaeramoeba flamelloides]
MESRIPVREGISSLLFGFYTPKEIHKMSVCEITSDEAFDQLNRPIKNGLYDPRMGSTDRFGVCHTCKLTANHCPGHIGHIDLFLPVYHPLFFGTLCKLLACKCLSCHRFKLNAIHLKIIKAKFKLIALGLIDEIQKLEELDFYKLFLSKDEQLELETLENDALYEDKKEEEEEDDEDEDEENEDKKNKKKKKKKKKKKNKHKKHKKQQQQKGSFKGKGRGIEEMNISNLSELDVQRSFDLVDLTMKKILKKYGKTRYLDKFPIFFDNTSRVGIYRRKFLSNTLTQIKNCTSCKNCQAPAPKFKFDKKGKVFVLPFAENQKKRIRQLQIEYKNILNMKGKDGNGPQVDLTFEELDYNSRKRKSLKEKNESRFATTAKYLTPLEVEEHIKLLWSKERDVFELFYRIIRLSNNHNDDNSNYNNKKFETFSDPALFFLTVLPVPPPKFRPPRVLDTAVMEHSQNLQYAFVVQMNHAILIDHQKKQEIDQIDKKSRLNIEKSKEKKKEDDDEAKNNEKKEKTQKEKISSSIDSWLRLQTAVNRLFDNTISFDAQGTQGIRQLMEKKQGLFRRNMMGKRVNYAARSVISPDPLIRTNEVGVPIHFAKVLSYPEPVNNWNVNKLKKAIINGPHKHPGANYYEDENGIRKDLGHMTERQRISLSKTLLSRSGFQSQNLGLNANSNFLNESNFSDNNFNLDSSNLFGGMNVNSSLKPKIVGRHLIDGDILLVNRQPTLHKPSMMTHYAKVLKTNNNVIRLHYANCNTYNADFDGDEMNLHFPQDELSRAEGIEIVSAEKQYLSGTDGSPLRGLIQDNVVAGVLLTKKDSFFTREEFMQLLFNTVNDPENIQDFDLVEPTILKPKKLWTGKQVITNMLNYLTKDRSPINVISRNKIPFSAWNVKSFAEDESIFRVINNEFITGVLEKSQFGTSTFGLIHSFYELYGAKMTDKLLSSISRLLNYYLLKNGFTCGIEDMIIVEEQEDERIKIIENMIDNTISDLNEFLSMNNDHEYQDYLEKTNPKQLKKNLIGKDFLKTNSKTDQICKKLSNKLWKRAAVNRDVVLNKLDSVMKTSVNEKTSKIIKTCIPNGQLKTFPSNNLSLMTISGAKGSVVNFSQISCLLGQQVLEGRRVPLMSNGKTLPCFEPYDITPRAGGFISDRFLTGLRPQEYFFHSMAGREGLVDTAIKTANSGYLQRCIIKSLEGLKVTYDGTVRDSDGSIIQFLYGEDSISVAESKFLDQFDFMINNYDALLSKYCPSKAIKYMTTKEALDYESQRKQTLDRKNVSLDPVINQLNPSIHLGSISESISQKMDKFMDKNIKDYQDLNNDKKTNKKNKKKKKNKTKKQREEEKQKMEMENTQNDIQSTKLNKKLAIDKFKSLVYLKYFRSLVHPGEGVGVIAGQSIGEPSTQMTLNSVDYNTNVLIKTGEGEIKDIKIGKIIDHVLKKNKAQIINYPENRTDYLDMNNSMQDLYIPSCDDKGVVRWSKVDAITRHLPVGKLMRVETDSGRKVIATQSHSFIIWNGSKFIKKRTTELKINDQLPTILNFPECKNVVNDLDLSKYLPHQELINRKQNPNVLKLNREFGFVCGVYLSDGFICADNKKDIIINNEDEHVLKEMENWCRSNKINCQTIVDQKQKNKNLQSKILKIESTMLSKLFENWIGNKSQNKCIPTEAYNSSLAFVNGLLDGYFSGDGSSIFINDNSENAIKCNSRSKKLMIGISNLCTRLGIFGILNSIKKGADNNSKDGNKKIYQLIIKNNNNIKLFCQKIKLTNLKKNNQMETIIKIQNNNQSKKGFSKQENVILDQIKKIEFLNKGSKYVYDFTVNNDHTFATSMGMICHNTFHLAGHGAANLTLGIPRLREIIMFASKNISTPSMTLPLKSNISKSQGMLITKQLSKITLFNILKSIVVGESKVLNQKSMKCTKFTIRMEFNQKKIKKFGLSKKKLERVLNTLPARILRKLKQRNKSFTKSNPKLLISESIDIETEVLEKDLNSKSTTEKKRQKNKKQRVSYDDSDEEEEEDKKKQKKKNSELLNEIEMEDDLGSVEMDGEKNQEDDDDEEKKEMLEKKKKKSKKKKQKKDKKALKFDLDSQIKNLSNKKIDNKMKKEFFYLEPKFKFLQIRLNLSLMSPKVIMVDLIEEICKNILINDINGIDNCYLIPDGNSISIMTEGVNFPVIWNSPNCFRINEITSNDVGKILENYGVEAARTTIINEIRNVFQAYGVSVDYRHLSLIADYMTFEGDYLAMNRTGIRSNSSALQKMSFETTTKFLIDAVLEGNNEELKSPSARIVCGRVVEHGTGFVDILQPLTNEN